MFCKNSIEILDYHVCDCIPHPALNLYYRSEIKITTLSCLTRNVYNIWIHLLCLGICYTNLLKKNPNVMFIIILIKYWKYS